MRLQPRNVVIRRRLGLLISTAGVVVFLLTFLHGFEHFAGQQLFTLFDISRLHTFSQK